MAVTRPLLPSDADRYASLRREMLADSPWSFSSSAEIDRGCRPEAVRALLIEPGNAIFAVEENEQLLAAASLRRDDRPKRRHIALIWGVYVTPSARGRGYGRAVVTAAIGAARGWKSDGGVSTVTLSVTDKSTTARRLYERLGFEVWGVEPDCLRIGADSYAEAHMRLRLV